MKKWISDKWGYLIFPLSVVGFILIIWIAIKFDLAEDAYDKDGNPNIEIHQQYGGR